MKIRKNVAQAGGAMKERQRKTRRAHRMVAYWYQIEGSESGSKEQNMKKSFSWNDSVAIAISVDADYEAIDRMHSIALAAIQAAIDSGQIPAPRKSSGTDLAAYLGRK